MNFGWVFLLRPPAARILKLLEDNLSSRRFFSLCLWTALATLIKVSALTALTSPEEFLGFRVGADYKLARYDRIIQYLEKLSQETGKVRYETVGRSTLGEPLVLTVISTAENMQNLKRYRDIARGLSDPRTLNANEAEILAGQGKVFLLLLCNQHSSEIASSNMALELAYDLAAGEDPELEKALEDVIVMLIPSANPDGQEMIVDYYDKYVGTPYEGGNLPWLYHHYAGHDDNRDWFMLNLAENDALVDVFYGNWQAQVLVDVHQMGMTGVRMFVPPFFDPPNPNNHLLIWNQIELLGAFMKFCLAEAGKKGVISNAIYSGWYQGSVRPNATQHNITALLTESAGVQIASPVYVDPAELEGTDKGLPEYGVRMNFTDPWPGGWWRLRDIVEYQLVAFKGLVKVCSDNRRKLLRNFYRMGAETVDLPSQGAPYAYLIPPEQRDPGSTSRMLKIFLRTRCEIQRSVIPFNAGNREWPAGTLVIKTGQPYGRFVKDLLEVKKYPDLRKYPGGPPQPPYDNAAWTLPLLMGVEVEEIREPFVTQLEPLSALQSPDSSTKTSPALLDCRDNNSYRAVNLLLKNKVKVSQIGQPVSTSGKTLPAGCFLAEGKTEELEEVARKTGAGFIPLEWRLVVPRRQLKQGKIGLYQGFVPSTDEGWTRYILDRFEFNYESLTNDRVRKGNLFKDYAVIILPGPDKDGIVKGDDSEFTPPEYRGGIGRDGIRELKEFVIKGGTLIAIKEACRLPVEEFDIPVHEELRGVADSEFFCPGSMLKLEVDNSHPLGYGMPEKGACYFVDALPLGTDVPKAGGPDRRVVARYGSEDILLSGWIIGERKIHGLPAVVQVNLGQGHVVLCGIGVQERAQSWGTFKLLFNAIFDGYR